MYLTSIVYSGGMKVAFLEGMQFRPVSSSNLPNAKLVLGQGQAPLEVIVTEYSARPGNESVRAAWKERHGGRPAPVLVVATYGNQAAICGPSGDNPPVLHVELSQA